ncbi:ribonuclease P protein component [Pseudogracilibacillus auburnensis]|uniref:Ribonuclease P protein component n=1 Tax=Pseudogracilibacillus auburnensis TaxID=1494959 RepID=A0A2V3W4A9_9BACI|nr:ribonuclease P protein component [Pseudogracilibacillus auburnensis]MBO1004171.1 ribonuclease P protein component [Pseudogracilibacillus auburnensis]PXW83589.1 ribonuclease P protein component [Pseudogracilibacillus auburnensis]
MKKAYRIKNNSEFQEILKSGKSFANRELVIYYKEKPLQPHFRLGISVGKKIGNAVTRNRIKRYVRESFLQLEETILPEVDIIIIARKPTVHMDCKQIKSSLSHLLRKQCLFI